MADNVYRLPGMPRLVASDNLRGLAPDDSEDVLHSLGFGTGVPHGEVGTYVSRRDLRRLRDQLREAVWMIDDILGDGGAA